MQRLFPGIIWQVYRHQYLYLYILSYSTYLNVYCITSPIDMELKNGRHSYIELIIACTIFGSSGVFLKHIQGMEVSSIIFYRLLFGFSLLLVYLLVTKRYDVFRLDKKKRYMFLIGVFNVITAYSYFRSIGYVGLSTAVLLLYTAPVYVTLLSPVFLREKITRRGLMSLFLSLIGIMLVVMPVDGFFGSGNHLLMGLLFGFISGLSYSGTIMTVSYLKTDYSGTSQLFWSALISLLILLPFGSKVPGEILEVNLLSLIIFGIVTTAFASLLYLNSAAKIPAQTVSVLALLEPVSGIIFGSLFLHEPIIMKTVQGCLLILIGASIMVLDIRSMPMQLYGMRHPFMSLHAAMRVRVLDIPRIIFMWLFGK